MVKYRRKAITAEMLARMEIIFADVLEKWRCRLVEFGGESDHVHMLLLRSHEVSTFLPRRPRQCETSIKTSQGRIYN